MKEFTFQNFDTLSRFAQQFGAKLSAGMLLGFIGPLGSGKTTFIAEMLVGMQAERTWVHSPTFGLIHEYPSKIPVVHFDLYRLEGKNPQQIAQSLDQLGLRDYLDGERILCMEWFDRLPMHEYDADLLIEFHFGKTPDSRSLKLKWPKKLPEALEHFLLGHPTSV